MKMGHAQHQTTQSTIKTMPVALNTDLRQLPVPVLANKFPFERLYREIQLRIFFLLSIQDILTFIDATKLELEHLIEYIVDDLALVPEREDETIHPVLALDLKGDATDTMLRLVDLKNTTNWDNCHLTERLQASFRKLMSCVGWKSTFELRFWEIPLSFYRVIITSPLITISDCKAIGFLQCSLPQKMCLVGTDNGMTMFQNCHPSVFQNIDLSAFHTTCMDIEAPNLKIQGQILNLNILEIRQIEEMSECTVSAFTMTLSVNDTEDGQQRRLININAPNLRCIEFEFEDTVPLISGLQVPRLVDMSIDGGWTPDRERRLNEDNNDYTFLRSVGSLLLSNYAKLLYRIHPWEDTCLTNLRDLVLNLNENLGKPIDRPFWKLDSLTIRFSDVANRFPQIRAPNVQTVAVENNSNVAIDTQRLRTHMDQFPGMRQFIFEDFKRVRNQDISKEVLLSSQQLCSLILTNVDSQFLQEGAFFPHLKILDVKTSSEEDSFNLRIKAMRLERLMIHAHNQHVTFGHFRWLRKVGITSLDAEIRTKSIQCECKMATRTCSGNLSCFNFQEIDDELAGTDDGLDGTDDDIEALGAIQRLEKMAKFNRVESDEIDDGTDDENVENSTGDGISG